MLEEFQSVRIPNFGPNVNISYPELPSFASPSPPPSLSSPSLHSLLSSLKPKPTSSWSTSQSLDPSSQPSLNLPYQEVKTEPSNNYRYFYWHPEQSSNLMLFQNYPTIAHNNQHDIDLRHFDSDSVKSNDDKYGKNYYNQIDKSSVKFNEYNYHLKYPASNYNYPKHNFINDLNPSYMSFDDHYSDQNDSIQKKIDQYVDRSHYSPNHNSIHYVILKTTSSNHAHTLEKINAWDIAYPF